MQRARRCRAHTSAAARDRRPGSRATARGRRVGACSAAAAPRAGRRDGRASRTSQISDAALLPDAQRAAPAAVADAVGGDLVDGQHDVLARASRPRPAARARAATNWRMSARSCGLEGEVAHRRARLRQRIVERRGRGVDAAVGVAVPARAALRRCVGWLRCAAAITSSSSARGVVRAQHRERRRHRRTRG